MGRYPRIEGKSFTYFISAEGRNSQQLFKDDLDKNIFLNLLQKQIIKSKLTFYAYIILPTLYACLLETGRKNLIRFMHHLNSDYANYFIRRHNLRNKIFHDRYKSIIIDKKEYLVRASRFLHLLPLKLKIATNPFQFKWSSLPGYIWPQKRQEWINYTWILHSFDKNEQKASMAYKNYLKEAIKQGVSSPFKNLSSGIILGNQHFINKILENMSQDESSWQNEELALAKKIIEIVDKTKSWPLVGKKRKKKELLSRNATIYFIKKFTELNNNQISTLFKPLKKSSISQMSRRFSMAIQSHQELRKITESLETRIKTLLLSRK